MRQVLCGRNDPGARRSLTTDTLSEPVSDKMIENLNARFEEIAKRLDTNRVSAEETGARMFQSLDARMEELAAEERAKGGRRRRRRSTWRASR